MRHDKGIDDFLTQIYSAEFTDPMDRQSFLAKTRQGQGQRYDMRCEQLNILASLTADNITSRAVETTKERFSAVSESEMSAMQDCYNGLTGLRTRLRFTAEERIELLRKELHVYGFLEPEPDLVGLAGLLQRAIGDPPVRDCSYCPLCSCVLMYLVGAIIFLLPLFLCYSLYTSPFAIFYTHPLSFSCHFLTMAY